MTMQRSRRDAHDAGGVQEEIRCGLAAAHHGRVEDAAGEIGGECDRSKREVYALHRAR